jgi:serine protease AprX
MDSLQHLIKAYIGAYIATLRSRQYKPLDKQWKQHKLELLEKIKRQEQWHVLHDLCILMLYYGTPVRAQAICDLIIEDVIHRDDSRIQLKVYQQGPEPDRYILIDEESSEVLNEYLSLTDRVTQIELFRHPDGSKLTPQDIFLLSNKYPNEGLVSELSGFFPIYNQKDYEIIPTPLRLNAVSRYTGKGVTIAFLDSGFYPHPDLTMPNNRVLAYVNIPDPEYDDFGIPQDNSWHGMQTTVSAAGNGYLSNSLYKGIASNANVVLLKATDRQGCIKTEYMIKGLKWVLENHKEYNIRVVNISLGEGREESYLDNALTQMAEALWQAGVVVVVAAGNDGNSPDNAITPPANAPSVITVGGFDDKNKLSRHYYDMYHSSYGPTIDGLMKPELIAPGIWVAAPILPETSLYREAEALSKINKLSDQALPDALREQLEDLPFGPEILALPIEEMRKRIQARLREQKIVGMHYQHVDGTSFSAPIVCSIIAQMFEANPDLSPRRIKQILTSTTDKIFNIAIEKQGHGLIHPRKCVKEAENDRYRRGVKRGSSPHVEGRKVTFYYDDPQAESVSVAGEFTDWKADRAFLTRIPNTSTWILEKIFPFKGIYAYKFVVNGQRWIPDPECENIEPDGFGGANTRLNLFLE